MTAMGFLVVGVGAAIGAWLRWLLGLGLNAVSPLVPLGTLTANVLGGYLAGLALAAFTALPTLAPEWRLLAITGFCGGLTTFSSFSIELSQMLQHGRYGLLGAAMVLHVGGSLTATLLGLATGRWLFS